MYSWKTTLQFDAPRDKVWDALIDFANMKAWKPGTKSSGVETEGQIGQGTRVRLEQGGGATVLTVEEWGPPRLLRLYLTRGRTHGSSRFYLTNAPNGGTQLEHTYELDPPIYLEPLMLFAGFGIRRELAALKRWVEKK
jgi:uncharacterized protein YndB with AHSA1/START domain